ncbi:MAG: cobyric acid synthase [Bryobacteraceae bacterium]
MTRALFVGGTASHVGKSWFTAALCRWLYLRRVRVAPFKAQNMSNNSYPCIEGGEIGRSQAMQAEACNLPPMADMNPVLLKPESEHGCQIVVRGRVWRSVPAERYQDHSVALMNTAFESYQRLSAQFDCMVCEGAGGVAEVNLMDRDITNLRFAERIGARTVLVADIERGGAFASLVGTMQLLPPRHRALVRTFAVNRFHGNTRLFDDGVRFLENRLGIPCLGVFPFTRDITLDDEDCLSIGPGDDAAETAAIRFPHISNFTDLRALPAVAWISKPTSRQYKTVILPGTKNTIADLLWLREQNLDEWILRQLAGGARIIGVCGGYQMLGESIEDPDAVESQHGRAEGLGLLPVRTTLQPDKITKIVDATTPNGAPFRAYEIHMGRTTTNSGGVPFAFLKDGPPDGCCAGNVMGTYLHGALENPAVLKEWLDIDACAIDKSAMYDRLAAWLEQHARKDVLEALAA